MKRILIPLLLLLFSASTHLSVSAQPDLQSQAAQDVIDGINAYRAENGLYALVFNQTLENSAQLQSEYQAATENLTHTGEGNTTSAQRMRAAGYGGGEDILGDEMIFESSTGSAASAIDWWKSSSEHNAILLSTVYHEIGVGDASSGTNTYFTVNVGAVPGVTSAGAGSPTSVPVNTSTPVETAAAGEDGAIYHQVESGQTLAGIASAYGVSSVQIALYNNISADSDLTAGTLLVIQLPQTSPTDPSSETAAASTTPNAGDSATSGGETTSDAGSSSSQDQGGQTSSGSSATTGSPNTTLYWVIGIVILVGAAGFVVYRQVLQKETDYEQEDEEEAESEEETFYQLSRKDQVKALAEMAREALKSYPLEVEGLEALRYVLNIEFLVTAKHTQNEDAPNKYVLRINTPGFHTKSEIRSELDWLNALDTETKVDTPVPIRNKNGDWVTTTLVDEVPEARHCVVFNFIPGDPIKEEDLTSAELEKVGNFVAQLHEHGNNFNPPAGFIRKHWDLEGLSGAMLDVPVEKAYESLTSKEAELIRSALEIVSRAAAQLGRDSNVYGLIHGDLHEKSYLFNQQGVFLLDFDTCGYGYFIYDLAVALWNLVDNDAYPQLQAALLAGYRQVRPLSEKEESLLVPFAAGRLVIYTLFLAAHRHDPALEGAADKAIQRQLHVLKQIVDAESKDSN